jgi:hypothetical protein
VALPKIVWNSGDEALGSESCIDEIFRHFGLLAKPNENARPGDGSHRAKRNDVQSTTARHSESIPFCLLIFISHNLDLFGVTFKIHMGKSTCDRHYACMPQFVQRF